MKIIIFDLVFVCVGIIQQHKADVIKYFLCLKKYKSNSSLETIFSLFFESHLTL